MRRIHSIDLKAILPTSISQDDQVITATDAISANLNEIALRVESDLIYSRVDDAQNNILDALAWQLHMDIYDSGLSRNVKIALVKGSIKYHRYKGTAYALGEAIKAVSAKSEVEEWFAYNGKPYHFKVKTATPFIDANHVKRLFNAIQDAKNVRSWLDEVDYICTKPIPLYAGVVKRLKRTITICEADETAANLTDIVYIGIAAAEEEVIEMEE